MTTANIFFLVVGVIVALVGLVMLIGALRSGKHDGSIDRAERRSTALLIAGMMLMAFGLVLGGFAIGYATTKPLDLNLGASS